MFLIKSVLLMKKPTSKKNIAYYFRYINSKLKGSSRALLLRTLKFFSILEF